MISRSQLTHCILIIGVMLNPMWVSGQSITASFDPTESVKMPAAASWRDTEGFGISYKEASGNRTKNGDETHRFDISGTTAVLHFKFSNISLDASKSQTAFDVTMEQTYEEPFVRDQNFSRINLSLLGKEYLSVGLGTREYGRHEFQGSENKNVEITESVVSGSISMKFLEYLYVGGGYERVKEKSDDSVENGWNNMVIGGSAIFGEAGSTRLRLEYSLKNSPRAEKDAQGTLRESIHNETNTTEYSAELMLYGLVFVARGLEEKLYFEDPYVPMDMGKKYDVVTYSASEAGVIWVPESGVALGFFFGTTSTTLMFEDKISEFRINAAYLFE